MFDEGRQFEQEFAQCRTFGFAGTVTVFDQPRMQCIIVLLQELEEMPVQLLQAGGGLQVGECQAIDRDRVCVLCHLWETPIKSHGMGVWGKGKKSALHK